MALARRRLAKANHERERLLQAYLADALPLDVLKREQKRVAKVIGLADQEVSRAEAADSPYRELLEFAVSLIGDAQERYSGGTPTASASGTRTFSNGWRSNPARSPELS